MGHERLSWKVKVMKTSGYGKVVVVAAFVAPAVLAQATGYVARPLGGILGQEALSLAGSPSGTQFVAGLADSSVRVFDAKSRATVKVFTGHRAPVRAVAWSPKGTWVASGAENAEIRLWNLKTGASAKMVGAGHFRNVNALWFSPDGTRLVSTSDDDTSRVWDVSKRKCIALIKGNALNIYGTRYDWTGKKLFASTLGKGLFSYSQFGVSASNLGGHPGGGADDLDVSKTGLGATAGRDYAVGLWNLKAGKRLSYLRGHEDWVVRVLFNPSGNLLASSSSDGTVRIWDTKSMRQALSLQEMASFGSPLAWVDNGNYLVAVAADGFPRVYKVAKV
jgi:WD40 repeat protein